MHEMETLQRRMEELQRQYMKDKETYRLQLVSSLLAARKTQVNRSSFSHHKDVILEKHTLSDENSGVDCVPVHETQKIGLPCLNGSLAKSYTVHCTSYWSKAVLRIRDVYPGSGSEHFSSWIRIFLIPDPNISHSRSNNFFHPESYMKSGMQTYFCLAS
jgi:hypothetical protein